MNEGGLITLVNEGVIDAFVTLFIFTRGKNCFSTNTFHDFIIC